MAQLWLLEPSDGPAWVEVEPEPLGEPIMRPPQLLVPEIERLQRVAEACRRRRAEAVPSRDPYLPGDRGDPPRRAGKIQPRRFSAISMLKAVPSIIPQFFNSAVPDEFWSRDADLAGPLAIVACPCGEEVEVPETQTAICECGRSYWNVVDRVLVGNVIAEPEPA